MKSRFEPPFASKLAPQIRELLAFKRSVGYSYNQEAQFLYDFDRFVREREFDSGRLDKHVVLAWCEQRKTECLNTRKYRADALRQLGKFLLARGETAFLPPAYKHMPRPLPYIPSKQEIINFFQYLDTHPKTISNWLINAAAPVAFRLYYSLGLRRAELTNLRLDCLDFSTGVMRIEVSKGDSQRIVYLPPDLCDLTLRYIKFINIKGVFSNFVFPRLRNVLLPTPSTTFSRILRQVWFESQNAEPGPNRPTLHALRHCFVVHKINDWLAARKNIHCLMPYLSKHLGHTSISVTYYYFHQIEHLCPNIKEFVEHKASLPASCYELKEEQL